ncbi:MAG: hypothetical protein J4G00_05330 [Actinomycetia bacterium]|nr:hypothetical protein [Actinomycetes bacterium]
MSLDMSRISTSLKRHPWIIGLSALIVAGWTLYGLVTGSKLALPYLLWMVSAGLILMYVDGRVRFSTHVLVFLCISGFCHMAGGNLVFEDLFLYEQSWGGIGYDHLVHVIGLGTAGLAVWEATTWILHARSGKEAALVAFLGANAVGAVIEIGEYLATLVLSVASVGDYANNMQDLIANMVGGLLAAWWASRGPRGIPRR